MKDISQIITDLRKGSTEAIGNKTGPEADFVLVCVQASDILRLCDAAGQPTEAAKE